VTKGGTRKVDKLTMSFVPQRASEGETGRQGTYCEGQFTASPLNATQSGSFPDKILMAQVAKAKLYPFINKTLPQCGCGGGGVRRGPIAGPCIVPYRQAVKRPPRRWCPDQTGPGRNGTGRLDTMPRTNHCVGRHRHR